MINKKFSLLLLGLLMSATAHSQISFNFISRKSTLQTGPESTQYTGGILNVRLSDGSFTPAPCVFNGTQLSAAAPVPFPPSSPIPFCPLGTTGFITSGDVDNDGISDIGEWWSFAAAPTPAAQVAPGRTDQVLVLQAPPSDFPRPGIFPVVDSGLTMWHNTLTGVNQRLYEIASYTYTQPFAPTPDGRREHDETVVTGNYKFAYPNLLDPNNRKTIISIDKLTMPESWPGLTQSPLEWGVRFTNDDAWNEAEQRMEFDPRFETNIYWRGIDPTNAIVPVDQLRIWIHRGPMADPTQFPANPPPFFPPPVAYPPTGVPFLMDPTDLYDGNYQIPPNILNLTIGQPLVFYLRLDRAFNSTGATGFGVVDGSSRTFGVNMMFVDTYEGFTVFSFPANTPPDQRGPDGDFDGDGFSNLIEFAMSSNHLDPASIPTTAPASGPAAPGTFSVASLPDGRCQVSIVKRPNIGGSLIYNIEHSADMVNWTTIPTGGDADWNEDINDAVSLQVTSVNPITAPTVPAGPPSCFFRVSVQAVR